MLNIKMSTNGALVIIFYFPGGRLAPLPPCQLRHWFQRSDEGHLQHDQKRGTTVLLNINCLTISFQ